MPLLPTLALALAPVLAPVLGCASTSGPKDAGDAEQAAAVDVTDPTPATLAAGDRIAKPKPKADPRATFGKAAPAPEGGQAVALFAAGCFWCIEKPFDAVPGVLATTSGYTDGPEVAPTYQAVSRKLTGHTEAIRVLYDPAKVTYAELLDVFWHNIDPTQADAQFCDKGPQYRAGIYTSDPAERALAEATKAEVARRLGADVVTEIDAAGPFWPAEEYHQDFYSKEPAHYERYRLGCGRDARLLELWGEAAVTGAGAGWIEAAAEAAGVALPGAGEEAGALEAGDASGDAAGDAATLPTPFTADQIRQAMPVGATLRLKTTSPEGTREVAWEVTAADADGLTIKYVDSDGAEKEERDTWAALRDHAAFPADRTTRETLRRTVLGQEREILRYTVRGDGGVERRFDFAADLPGPPVEMVVTRDGQQVMAMELLEAAG